ncbi:hypothetical protein Trydic_g17674 [Trypoxylus dichotomus]
MDCKRSKQGFEKNVPNPANEVEQYLKKKLIRKILGECCDEMDCMDVSLERIRRSATKIVKQGSSSQMSNIGIGISFWGKSVYTDETKQICLDRMGQRMGGGNRMNS